MFISMHCGGMPFNGETIKKRSLGGSESAGYYLARELAARGHRVTVWTNSQEEGIWDDVRYCWVGQTREKEPMGERFSHYAQHTPQDVLVVQRHPFAFRFNYLSKVNMWWLHDLALKRSLPHAQSMLWNIDAVLPVSEWHGKQIEETWSIEPDVIMPIRNGVDLSLWGHDNGHLKAIRKRLCEARGVKAQQDRLKVTHDEPKLLYAARPERGLEHLVRQGGIMDELLKGGSDAHLYVCGYDNTMPEMAQFYQAMKQEIQRLPNVTDLGALTKQELAALEEACDLYVYPTLFEDTSCIMAMECAAAGLPFLHSPSGAVPETVGEHPGGTQSVPYDQDGQVSPQGWAHTIQQLLGDQALLEDLSERQREAANHFTWVRAADLFEQHVKTCFKRKQRRPGTNLRWLINNSDYYAAMQYANRLCGEESKFELTAIEQRCMDELRECYAFARENTWADHYKVYYDREYDDKQVPYGPQTLDHELRYHAVVAALDSANFDSGFVLDYGCAHGHYTINLAKRFPQLHFVGVDITPRNIATAKSWAEADKVDNVTFISGEFDEVEEFCKNSITVFQAALMAEVLEHVPDPVSLVDDVRNLMEPDGLCILTTPYGPWEHEGYREEHPWRAHVHHFERQDLRDLWGYLDEFNITVAPFGPSKKLGVNMGSYVTSFRASLDKESGWWDYNRKLAQLAPEQTLSVCMIVHNAEATLRRCLDSLVNVASEVVIGLDKTTDDSTEEVIREFCKANPLWPVVSITDIESPLETGFDEARNTVIDRACGDWVLWIDDDEVFIHTERLHKYLRTNNFNAYSVKQHHFAVEPLGVMKTDLPARLFRNGRGVRFYGVVHEHPEVELNKGIPPTMLIPDVDIAHEGYTTQAVRRGRFDRNINLMARDRDKYPERHLGKFLWIRDLAQMCQHELEAGAPITAEMKKRAALGLRLWEELLHIKDEDGSPAPELRMLTDGLEFYSVLSAIAGPKFSMTFSIDAEGMIGPPSNHTNGARPLTATFASKDHARELMSAIFESKVKEHEGKYL